MHWYFFNPIEIIFQFIFFYAFQTLFLRFYWSIGIGFPSNIGKKSILSNDWFFSFHLIPYRCKSFKFSLANCGKSTFYLWFIYLIEFILFMHVHLNNCLFNFTGSRFRIEFECAWWSTSPKISQALIKRKIPKTTFWLLDLTY